MRKKTKFYDYFNKEGGEKEVSVSDESEDDDFNPEIEGEEEEPEEEFEPKIGSESEGEGGGDLALPPKKRKARPADNKGGDAATTEDSADNVNASKLSQEKKDGEEVLEDESVGGEERKDKEPKEESETKKESTKTTLDDVSLQTPRPEAPSEGKEVTSAEDDSASVEDDNAGGLGGSVTEETPNDENPLGDTEEAILTSATEKMEEGDAQYKNELAEWQMYNIFN